MDAASDAKPEKNIARKMMLMAIDINKNYFRDMVTHDMDHDHDMNKDMSHDSAKIGEHDLDKNKEHGMDTGMVAESSKYMLRSVTRFLRDWARVTLILIQKFHHVKKARRPSLRKQVTKNKHGDLQSCSSSGKAFIIQFQIIRTVFSGLGGNCYQKQIISSCAHQEG